VVFLRIFVSTSVVFQQQTTSQKNARHLQVRLGGGFRGPGPRANVGLEKAVSKEAAFFCLRLADSSQPVIDRGRDFVGRVLLNKMTASDAYFRLIREAAAILSLRTGQNCARLSVDEQLRNI
jgi:hypothetical protein